MWGWGFRASDNLRIGKPLICAGWRILKWCRAGSADVAPRQFEQQSPFFAGALRYYPLRRIEGGNSGHVARCGKLPDEVQTSFAQRICAVGRLDDVDLGEGRTDDPPYRSDDIVRSIWYCADLHGLSVDFKQTL